jgi:hypothetical protein
MEWEAVNWIDLVGFVKTVINIQVLWKVWNFSASWGTVSLSGRTVLLVAFCWVVSYFLKNVGVALLPECFSIRSFLSLQTKKKT